MTISELVGIWNCICGILVAVREARRITDYRHAVLMAVMLNDRLGMRFPVTNQQSMRDKHLQHGRPDPASAARHRQ